MSTKPHYEHMKPTQWRKAHYLWWTFFLVNMAFVWITPLDVLDRYPQLVAFTDFMASWNTQIRHLGEYSGAASQANRFCASVLWCVMPLAWFAFARAAIRSGHVQGLHRKSNMELAMLLVVSLLLLYVVMSAPSSADIPMSRLGRFMFIHSLGRAFFLPAGAFMVGFLGWCLTAAVGASIRKFTLFVRGINNG